WAACGLPASRNAAPSNEADTAKGANNLIANSLDICVFSWGCRRAALLMTMGNGPSFAGRKNCSADQTVLRVQAVQAGQSGAGQHMAFQSLTQLGQGEVAGNRAALQIGGEQF